MLIKLLYEGGNSYENISDSKWKLVLGSLFNNVYSKFDSTKILSSMKQGLISFISSIDSDEAELKFSSLGPDIEFIKL